MISFRGVTFGYGRTDRTVLRDVNVEVPEAAFCLVVGPTGSGKSTLLKLVNGLAPHFTGGTLYGEVSVAGRNTATHRPRELADVVGYVAQEPQMNFVTDVVEDELAYVMEQLALPRPVMRKRMEETLDLLALATLRRRPLATLSGGEQQRVAMGAVLTAHPAALVLDEPTSALDPTAAEEVLAALTRLVHDLGVTVVLAEHRLDRVLQYADQVVSVGLDGRVRSGTPAEMMAQSLVTPPVVDLARLVGWEPIPLTIREARRRVPQLRARLGTPPPPPPSPPGPPLVEVKDLSVVFGPVVAVRGFSLEVSAGEVVAVMGRNGSGKSSLLWAVQGSGPRVRGAVTIAGIESATLGPGESRSFVGLVPQNPTDLLYLESVIAECDQSDRDAAAQAGTTWEAFSEIARGVAGETHPRDLSEGQRLALVLAIQLAAAPRLILLDEPTRGLDYSAKRRLARIITSMAAGGMAVVVATHDVEFAAAMSHRVVVMAEGGLVADGPTVEVVTASPVFAPQIAKVMAPDRWLTVEQIESALVGS